jgi:DNA-binding SARP family transcriptional activator
MELRILEPLEMWDGGCELPLGARKPRALLALLLLHPTRSFPPIG